MKPRGVIYTVAPSPRDPKRIWAGNDDGLVHLTSDGGKTWTDVTPPEILPWQKISIIDAGHFDVNTAYAAVNTLRLDDIRPHIYRTNDAGKTWKEIVHGIPEGQTVNVVREDTQRKGLLFAGTERAVYISFDDGENWQSLRLNMPATSIRDLIVKDDDLAVGTHGRGFWILDNISPLRQVAAGQEADTLFKPQTAWRVRWNLNTDTPLPPDEPAGENPPDGAMIDYFLAMDSADAITLEIKDKKGNVVRRYASTDAVSQPDAKELRIPFYWVRAAEPLQAKRGMHRFLWDMRYAPVLSAEIDYPMTAIYEDTPPRATAPWVEPGEYSVVLTATGKSLTQPLIVKMDPRVKSSSADLAIQFDLSKKLYEMRSTLEPISKQLEALYAELGKAKEGAGDQPVKEQIESLAQKLREFGPPNPRPGAPFSIDAMAKLKSLFGDIQDSDAAPTPRVQAAVAEILRSAQSVATRGGTLLSQELPALNQQLEAAGLPKLEVEK